MPEIIIGTSPFDLTALDVHQVMPETTIGEFLRAGDIRFHYPVICLLNSPENPLLREEWGSILLSESDKVVFLPLVQGGGGGSNPLKIILGIALIVFSGGIAGFIGGAMGTAAVTGAMVAKFGAAVLLSAFAPVQKPPQLQGLGDIKDASPTYSITAQGNRVTLGNPIPKVYGRHMIYPPYIAAPWTTYLDNKQHLIQVFIIGHGQYQMDDVRIEDTALDNFGNIAWAQLYADDTGQLNTVRYNNTIAALTPTPPSGTGGFKTTSFSPAEDIAHHQVVSSLEVSGQLLYATNETDRPTDGWIGGFTVNRPGTKVSRIMIDLQAPRGLYYANDNGSFATRTVTWEVQARKLLDNGQPDGAWFALASPYTASGTGSRADNLPPIYDQYGDQVTSYSKNLIIDLGVRGATNLSFSGSTAQINSWSITAGSAANNTWDILTVSVTGHMILSSDGDSWSESWGGYVKASYSYSYQTTAITATKSGATNEAQQWSLEIPVPEARYEIRVRRTDAKDTSARAGHELRWVGLKGIITAIPQYRDMTLLYVRLIATDSLSQQSSQKINCIVQAKLPVWDGAGWTTPQLTRNPAWAIADVLRARYSANLDNSRFSTSELKTLAEKFTERDDNFDYVADQQITVWEMLQKIGKTVRTVPSIKYGVVRLIRDQPRLLPSALFTPAQIVRGSMQMEFIIPGERTADWLEVEYFDSDTWSWQTLTVGAKPQVIDAKPTRLRIDGITGKNQAIREAVYLINTNVYRRQFVTFQTEMAGFIPSFGDMIAVCHDLPAWGQHATLESVENSTLTVDKMLEWSTGSNHYAAFRRADGTLTNAYPVTQGAAANTLVLSSNDYNDLRDDTALKFFGDPGTPTSVVFGASESLTKDIIVLKSRPRGMTKVEISGVLENSIVHQADTLWADGLPLGASVVTIPAGVSQIEIIGTPAMKGQPALNVVYYDYESYDHGIGCYTEQDWQYYDGGAQDGYVYGPTGIIDFFRVDYSANPPVSVSYIVDVTPGQQFSCFVPKGGKGGKATGSSQCPNFSTVPQDGADGANGSIKIRIIS